MAQTHPLEARTKQELQDESTRPGPVFRPEIDILERADRFVIYADLPGVDEKSIDVRIDRGLLTLEAQLATVPDPGWHPLHTEYRFGSYHRDFRISQELDPNGVSATMRNGVLELTLPKSAARQPRAIPVQSA